MTGTPKLEFKDERRKRLVDCASRRRAKQTSLDDGERQVAAESDAAPLRAFAERRVLHPGQPDRGACRVDGGVQPRVPVHLGPRGMEQREQKQLLEAPLRGAARDPEPAALTERRAAALQGPGALALALGALTEG